MLDLGSQIRDAQNKLLALAKRDRRADDDAATFWETLSAFASIMWRVTDRWVTVLEDMRAVVSQQRVLNIDELSEAAAKGVSNVMMAELIRAMNGMLARRQKALLIRTALISVAGTAVVLGGLYLWLQPSCVALSDGSSVCGIWTHAAR